MCPSNPFSRVVVLTIVILAGAGLRVWLVGRRPIAWDERSLTNNAVSTSYGDLIRTSGNEVRHPPLSFMLMKFAAELAGEPSVRAARLVSLAFGILCIPAAYALGSTILGPVMGLLMATFAAFDPLLVDQSTQARQYAMLCFCTLVALGLLTKLMRTRDSATGMAAALGTLLAVSIWNNQLGFIAWCTVPIALLLPEKISHRYRLPEGAVWKAAVVVVTSLILISPIFHLLRGKVPPNPVIASSSGVGIATVVTHDIFERMQFIFVPASQVWLAVFLLALLGVGALARRVGRVALPLVLVLGLSLLFGVLVRLQQSYFAERYLVCLLPSLWAGYSMLFIITRGWPRWLLVVLATLFLAAQIALSVQKGIAVAGIRNGSLLRTVAHATTRRSANRNNAGIRFRPNA